MAAPGQYFESPRRGEIRADWLAAFRATLRTLRDPVTGAAPNEADIVRATQDPSRWFAHADATELTALAIHAKCSAMLDQMFPSRSTSTVLRELHAPFRGVTPLPAAGATLRCEAVANVGAVFVGSTTLGDPIAAFATDVASGLRFQVLYTVVTPTNAGNPTGTAGSDPLNPLYLVGVDTGERTNLPFGSKLKWGGNYPLSAAATFVTVDDPSGGIDAETDLQLATRIEDQIAEPPESGNCAHYRSWVRKVLVSVEDGFVYACAFYAGSLYLTITQRRGRQSEAAPKGPLARIPSAGTLAIVRAYVTPPASPVAPERVLVLVGPPIAQPINMVLGVSVPRTRGLGWTKGTPWPGYTSNPAVVTVITDPTHFRMSCDIDLPTTTEPPDLMVWVTTKTRWEKLNVLTVTDAGGGLFDVALDVPPAHVTAVGDWISPLLFGIVSWAQGVERYFDSLGPSEILDLATDTRAPRAARFPAPVVRYPTRAGSTIISTLQQAIPGTISTGQVLEQSATDPTVPSHPTVGPSMLTCGKFAVYPDD